jgi:hypothetical protein
MIAGPLMRDEIVVRVYDVIGGPVCVSTADGQKVYDKIVQLLREEEQVSLSFDRVNVMIPAFLNAAIGQLYGEFSESKIRELLAVRDVAQEDMALLKCVGVNAKKYFSNRTAFDQAWQDETGIEV